MTMNKINIEDPDAQSADIIAGNIEQLKSLFPELIAEGINGVSVNVDVLKALVGDSSTTDADEKYGLNWHGKRRARQLALTPSTGTLLPCPEESVDWDTTQNLMIEGDNLEVLKLMQKSYAGKVKLIYIDPPYNTGKDFVYPDDFHDNIRNYLELTGQVEGGQKISSHTEASGRFHTDWLNMMYPRLKLARNLLRDDGAIFCSIDDIEAPRLRILLDDIFGEDNFLAQFSWRTDGNFDNQAKIKTCHEYILLYTKVSESFQHPPVVDPNTPTNSKLFRPEIRNTIIKNGPKNPISSITLPKGFPAEFEKGRIASRTSPWPLYLSDAIVENGRLVEPVIIKSGWSSKELVLEFINNNCAPIKDKKGQETSFLISKSGAVEAIKRRSDYQSHVISVLNGFGGTQKATSQLSEIGAFFNGYPKPVDLIRYFIQMASGNDGLFLDFFAGSGPCGHAVIEQNAKDAGTRKYILVQIPEQLDLKADNQKDAVEYCKKIHKPHTIAELTKERLRRAGEKIKTDNPEWKGDSGFRVFKLAHSNIRPWDTKPENLEASLLDFEDHLIEGRSEADILYELLLKRGLDLCVPIDKRIIAELEVYSVTGGVLIACLAEQINQTDVETLASGIITWREELVTSGDTTCVFRDSAFADDVAKTNLVAILEQHGIQNVRSL